MNRYNSTFLPCPFRIPHYHLADKNIVTIRVIKFVVLVVIAIILTIGGNDMSLTLIISKILEDSLARILSY